MKRGVIFGLFISLIIILFPSALAANTCSDSDQIILRLSSDSNAHGETYNGIGGYTTEICYDDIFGTPGNGDRTCSGTNKIIGLSSNTNAHAQDPSLNTYGTPICYGNLACQLRTNACQTGEFPVVRLSSATNAHLERGDAPSPNYNNIVCCSVGGGVVPNLEKGYWANIAGNELTSNAQIVLGDSVQSVAEGVSVGENVLFNVYDDDPGVDDLIATFSVSAASETAKQNWAPSPSEYQIGFSGADDLLEGDLLELYFIASVASSGYNQRSQDILLSNNIALVEIAKNGCVQFTSQNQCENAGESIWRYDEMKSEELLGHPVDGASGAGCGGTRSSDGAEIQCECAWANNICKFRWVAIVPSIPPNEENCVIGCNVETDYGACTDNTARVTYYTNTVALSSCTGSNHPINAADAAACNALNGQWEEVLCGLAPSLILPFYDFKGILISAGLIFIIYFIFILKRR